MSVFTRSSLRGRSARLAAAAAVTAASVIASGCGSTTARQGTGSSYPVIVALEGANGAGGTNVVFSTQAVASDVLTFVRRTSTFTIFSDPGRVTMRLAMRDVTNPVGPTDNNAITFNRYRVAYRRTDGRNTQGVDVPFAFDGGISFTVSGGQEVRIPFELVRVQAKEEAPLRALAGAGGAIDISTIADVTFIGADQTGRAVSVTASISVNFADWGDPDS